ncbi:hydroxycarboxylic acid receptor 2 [Perca fluviatilis]|uniref:hydroxycarboxylic acid receptor 2 n=1 Tax=Perca fluviatilis TaxID=8168 RepID=UPI001966C219|nr:hydroxycarboxylic acid receptor 2 [Perca fluviatilis]
MANTTASPFQLDCEASDKTLYKFYAAATIVIFILALPLNASILYLFIFKLKFWKSNSNNIFLFNLVLADILLIFCLPVIAYNYIQGERRIENDAGYKAMLFMLFLNRGGSIAFLTVISIDRYLHVVHHGRRNLLKVLKKSALISILIWLFLVPLTIPTMLKNFDCNRIPNENKVVDIIREFIFFTKIVIPFVILVYCTVRIVRKLRKQTIGDTTKLKRAVFLVTCVMVVFSFSFLPCTIARVVLLIAHEKWTEPDEEKVSVVFDGLMLLSYLNCLLDPAVYCFSSTKFKGLYLSTYFPFLIKKVPLQSLRVSTIQRPRNDVI